MQSIYHNKDITSMFVKRSQDIDYGVVEGGNHSASESQRNYVMEAFINARSFLIGNTVTRVNLPHDTLTSIKSRELEYRRQAAMSWNSNYQETPTDGNRENNYAQNSFVKQRQLSAPSTYGQWRAFMTALSAAFGNVK